jgi:hypothetical protein
MVLGWPFGKKQQKEVQGILGIEEVELTKEELNLLAKEDDIRKELDELEAKDRAREGQLIQTREDARRALEKGNHALVDKLMKEYEEFSGGLLENISNEVQKNELRIKLEAARAARIKKGLIEAREAERVAG